MGSYLDKIADVISCDESGEWLSDPVEEKNEKDFFSILYSCASYEEFMMNAELMQEFRL